MPQMQCFFLVNAPHVQFGFMLSFTRKANSFLEFFLEKKQRDKEVGWNEFLIRKQQPNKYQKKTEQNRRTEEISLIMARINTDTLKILLYRIEENLGHRPFSPNIPANHDSCCSFSARFFFAHYHWKIIIRIYSSSSFPSFSRLRLRLDIIISQMPATR